jgi:predicted porin
MKKKLLMAAVGAALVAGPTVAVHAGTTLYGHMHLSYDRFDSDNNTENGNLANNSSRFGIKGDEDLGGGLKAIYQIESNIVNIDDGSCGLAGSTSTTACGASLRNSFVGFAGSWGTVKIGRHDTPYKDLGRKLDDFNEQVGDMRTMIGNGSGTFEQRISNMIRYDSPKFAGGLTASVAHTSNNGSDDFTNTAQKNNSLAVNWTSGPIFLGAAWNETGSTSTSDQSGIRLAGSYKFNDWVVGALYETMSDLGGTPGADRSTMALVASLKMGNNKLKFHYVDADKRDDVADSGGSMWAIGVDHSLSKTVTTYFNYASVDNDPAASFNTASGPGGHDTNVLPTAAGKSPTAFSAGMILKF